MSASSTSHDDDGADDGVEDESAALTGGRRRDGKPYAPGNTDKNGDYIVGKGRAPQGGQFQKGDGRKRGKRKKGSKNLSTVVAKQLGQKRTINDKTMTNLEWLVDGMVRRGITKSDRAGEILMNRAERLEQATASKLRQSDAEVLAEFVKHVLGGGGPTTTDDHDIGYGEADDEDTDDGGQIGDDDADQ